MRSQQWGNFDEFGDHWEPIGNVDSYSFECGYCGKWVGSTEGIETYERNRCAYVCPMCQQVSYWDGSVMTPRPIPGKSVPNLPNGIHKIYDEVRKSIQACAYTGSVQLCRTLIGHVAVNEGAPEHNSFQFYIDYLDQNHHIHAKAKPWVQHIKDMGNEANHDLRVFGEKEASDILEFTRMLLVFLYELPAKLPAPK